MRRRYVRVGDELHDDTTLVVRGGLLDEELIRADASRYCAIYGVCGVSVFAARDVTVDELAQVAPLVRFAVHTGRGAEDSSLQLGEPTGRNPCHFTVAWDDLDEGIGRLLACERNTWPNPYYEQ